jgi:hypothetical protein
MCAPNRRAGRHDGVAPQRGDQQAREFVAGPHRQRGRDASVWEANAPREKVLRLYKFLNQLGYTVIGIDAAIEREKTKNRAADSSPDVSKRARP